jgi:polyisoprenoid-binding protein YceI
MKTIRISLIAIMMIVVAFVQAQDFKADLTKSKVKWTGEKLTGKHFGHISLKDGSLTLKSGNISTGTFVIDMTSIVDEDLENAEYNAKLVNHLKSDDFFGVTKFPEAKLVITKATPFAGNVADVTANLTIKNKTNPSQFKVTKSGNTYTAHIVVDRSKYDVKYGSKTFFEDIGDKVIYDEFILDVELVVTTK